MLDCRVVGLHLEIEIAEQRKRRRGFGMLAYGALQDKAHLVVIVDAAVIPREAEFGGQVSRRNSQRFLITCDRVGVSLAPSEGGTQTDSQVRIARGEFDCLLVEGG